MNPGISGGVSSSTKQPRISGVSVVRVHTTRGARLYWVSYNLLPSTPVCGWGSRLRRVMSAILPLRQPISARGDLGSASQCFLDQFIRVPYSPSMFRGVLRDQRANPAFLAIGGCLLLGIAQYFLFRINFSQFFQGDAIFWMYYRFHTLGE